jgi:hypothetical protein
MRWLVALCLLILTASAWADNLRVVTIQVKSQPAAALLGTVQPLITSGGGVSAFHDKLIVRGTETEIVQVRELLAEIDRPPRRLLIEVRQSGGLSLQQRDIGYGVGNDNVQIGRVPPGGGGQVRYNELQTRARDSGTQQVRAIDGRPAFIRDGQSVPVYSGHQGVVGNTWVQGFNVRYRETGSGFYALPRVHGDQVTVEIYQRNDRAAENGVFNVQQASSVLRGPLGGWMTLASTGGADSDSGGGIGRHVQTRRSSDRLVELRVIAVD